MSNFQIFKKYPSFQNLKKKTFFEDFEELEDLEDLGWKMTSVRPFKVEDLFEFNNVNLDVLTETYFPGFYVDYMCKWPEYFVVQEAPGGQIMSYSKIISGLFAKIDWKLIG